MNTLDDRELARLAANGNMAAIESLYRRHYPLLLSFGIKYYADREFVRDCIQDLYVKIISRSNSLRQVEYVRSWLLVSLKNIMFDRLKVLRPYTPLDELPFTNIDAELTSFTRAEGLDDEELRTRREMVEAFAALSGQQRMAIYLHFVKGMSHREVAAFLDINVQSSKNLLFRALSKMRRSMLPALLAAIAAIG